jgi:hypothetical protein
MRKERYKTMHRPLVNRNQNVSAKTVVSLRRGSSLANDSMATKLSCEI